MRGCQRHSVSSLCRSTRATPSPASPAIHLPSEENASGPSPAISGTDFRAAICHRSALVVASSGDGLNSKVGRGGGRGREGFGISTGFGDGAGGTSITGGGGAKYPLQDRR